MIAAERKNALVDAFGRCLQYLRLSVTDRCNFRCLYCLPHGVSPATGPQPLSAVELVRLVRGFAELGFTKVRVTGGEPTVRGDVVEIVGRIAAIEGVRDVGMTTNGFRLKAIARDLAGAGLTSLNVSVDSLDPDRFASITGRSLLPQVLDGLEAALAAGIPRIKVNAVLLAGKDTGEIERFMAWVRVAPITVRFIELMDAGVEPTRFARYHVPISRVEQLLEERGWSRLAHGQASGPATDYGKAGHAGRIGVIAPRPKGACARCNRLRVSATGDLRLCLFDDRRVSLRHLLHSDAQRPALEEAIRNAVAMKPAARPVEHRQRGALRGLASIGG